jgi:hypothetical protein
MLDGKLPYRDFRMEYPPGAALLFVLPATEVLAGGPTEEASWHPANAAARRYYRGYATVIGLLLGVLLILTAVTLHGMRRSRAMVVLALGTIAVSPLLIGQVLPERFDVLPAALTAAALAASVHGRYRLGGVLLGLGTATKLYPALLVPVLVIVVARRRGSREATRVAVAATVAVAAVFLPFAIASFSGTWEAVKAQFGSGLQVESLAASVRVLSGDHLTIHPAGGELNRADLVGPGIAEIETATKVVVVLVLCFLWVSLSRSTCEHHEALLRYAAASVAALLALGPVLSPQYIVWLLPLVPLVAGRRGAAVLLLFILAAGLTNVWIPEHYFAYLANLDAHHDVVLLARNLALLATAVALTEPWLLGGIASSGKPE